MKTLHVIRIHNNIRLTGALECIFIDEAGNDILFEVQNIKGVLDDIAGTIRGVICVLDNYILHVAGARRLEAGRRATVAFARILYQKRR